MKTYCSEQEARKDAEGSVYKALVGENSVYAVSIEDAMQWIDKNKIDNEWSKIVEYKERLINIKGYV